MKHPLLILTALILSSCGPSQPESENEVTTPPRIDTVMTKPIIKPTIEDEYAYFSEFSDFAVYNLTDTIIADFNGDGVLDRAIYLIENQTSGIVITHGQTDEEIRIGFGVLFAHLHDFNWVQSWALVKDPDSHEIVVEDGEILGGRKVELENPSISVQRLEPEEQGGGLITYKNGMYVWIHQSD
jgi:hypothetical protein